MSYSGSFRQTGPFYTAEGAAFATSASIAQTGLCEAATDAAVSAASLAESATAIKLTQAEYDLIVPDPDKIYFIVG